MTTRSSARSRRTLGTLIGRQLQELGRTPAELATAIEFPTKYVDDLIAGRRQAPSPARSDIYRRMTTFLKLGRTDLTSCAAAEQASATAGRRSLPRPNALRALLALCVPEAAERLEEGRSRGDQELIDLIERVLHVTKASIRSSFAQSASLKAQAKRRGASYAELRLRMLDFLESTPATLTAGDVAEFLAPRIEEWNVEPETGVLRVVLKPQAAPEHATPRPT